MNVTILAKLKNKPWLRRLGYPAFFNAAFLGGIYLTFPYDQLRDRIVSEAEKATGYDVEIEKVRLAGVSGITLHGVDVGSADADEGTPTLPVEGEAAAEGEGAEAPPPPAPKKLHLDAVTAKADLLALAMGKRAVKFDVDAFGGSLRGKVVMGDEEQFFRARGRKIDFGQSPLKALAGLDLVGRIDTLDVELRSPGPDFSKADGTVEIKGEELNLNGGEVQMFELPAVALGTMNGRIEFKEGVADFEEFAIEGADLEAKVDGNIRLSPVLSASSVTGKLRIKPSDDWWNRNEMLKTAANFALPAGKDGWRTISIYGPLSSPKFRPQK
ncbi:type II secretion system protein GspN [Vulgatibacter sp.]|uniref:type II secretion system protein GspN n=1 Tax=Vulgatibacter sp. TaxID=1971226 RepID=UPI003562C8C0